MKRSPKKVTRKVIEDIFRSLDGDATSHILGSDIVEALERAGLARLDPRLSDMMDFLDERGGMEAKLTIGVFEQAIVLGGNLVVRALTNKLAIPDWPRFVEAMRTIFEEVRAMDGGETASYIPELKGVDPNYYAVSVCTVDGQVLNFGDADVVFQLQSCSKPVTYCQAVAEHGLDFVHRRVGFEPSGRKFNELSLRPVSPLHESLSLGDDEEDEDIGAGASARDKPTVGFTATRPPASRAPTQRHTPARIRQPQDPHQPPPPDVILAVPYNPMVNAGAQICAALLLGQRDVEAVVKEMLEVYRRLCLGRVTVNASVFLSERGTADRNRCLAYMMKESGALPRRMDIERMLELYFLACAIEVNTRQLATLAASLSRGGINPFTHDRVFESSVVRHCLSLMFSCGLYDASGKWAFSVGVPAKSGVAGAIYGSVPNVMGIAVWSPRLDSTGNSTRGVRFFERLGATFAIHMLDSLGTDKEDPTKTGMGPVDADTHLLVAAAAQNDVSELQTLIASGCDINAADYDRRTALHLAAAEGAVDCVIYLLHHGANPAVRDRWGHTPASEAKRGGHTEVLAALERAERGERVEAGLPRNARSRSNLRAHLSHSAASIYEREASAFVQETAPPPRATSQADDDSTFSGAVGMPLTGRMRSTSSTSSLRTDTPVAAAPSGADAVPRLTARVKDTTRASATPATRAVAVDGKEFSLVPEEEA